MKYIEYYENNSGGYRRLKDHHWDALEKAGWRVVRKGQSVVYDSNGNVVMDGDLPKVENVVSYELPYAFRAGLSLKMAIAEWEEVTGLNHKERGCPCCGRPHEVHEEG